ncbi:MAG: 50S ribosomal protein L4 [Immundisolibacter sp.]|uniref:50S ribosomal protein L4 n=1 Tax=Immundisolibacter sp. TaxID=1934948 RepID=UPI003EE23621
MELPVTAVDGTASSVTLADEVFDRPYNEGLVHQLVVAFMANGRQADAKQKTRSEVRGGGRKPWKQKGSGRARAGSIRSPLWRGGGKIFPGGGENYSQKLNKKVYRVGMRSIFSELLRLGRLQLVDGFPLEAPKTRALVGRLAELEIPAGNLLLVVDELSAELALASRNLVGVEACEVQDLNPLALIWAERVVLTPDAVRAVQEWLQ